MKRLPTVVLSLFIFLWPPLAVTGEDLVYTEKEIVRNGDFRSYLYTAWHVYWCDVTSLARKGEEGCGLRMENLGVDDNRYAFQTLTLPTELTSARLSFDYRAEADVGVGVDGQPVLLEVTVASSTGLDSENLEEASPLTQLGILFSETVTTEFDWRSHMVEIDPALMSAMYAAHAAGDYVFLQFAQRKTDTYDKHGFYADIDNVSLKVSGRQKIPEMQGLIAYLEENEDGDPFAISTLDPETHIERLSRWPPSCI